MATATTSGDGCQQAFERVRVHYAVRGQAVIHWTVAAHFRGQEPWTFQLQVSQADIDDPNAYTNVGAPLSGSWNTQAVDNQARAFGKIPTVYYRVQLTTADVPPRVYLSPPATVWGELDNHSWALMQEMVRKDLLRLARRKVGVRGWLLADKRSGTPCTRCTSAYTDEQTDSACPVCFGRHYVGGYYRAQADVYVDLAHWEDFARRDLEERGTVDDSAVTAGHFVGQPIVHSFDVWVNAQSDLRYYLFGKKVVAHIRGVPFVYEVEMRLAPFSDVIYTVPLEEASST